MNGPLQLLKDYVAPRARTVLTRTELPRLDIFRVAEPTKLFPEIYQPMVSLILQGEKQLLIGDQVLRYAAGHTFIASVDLPATGEIVRASASVPYLAVRLIFDLGVVADLVRDVPDMPGPAGTPSFCVGPASDDLIDAWLRLMRLLERSDEIPVMAPLLEREILFRLLRGPQGAVLRQAAGIDGQFLKIKKILVWLGMNYASPVRVEELARAAGMSASAFHRAFKASTGFSPLQYQKHLRLYDARRTLFAQPGDVAAVAAAVGYESLSQFTREYARMFGAPPARDIKELRANAHREFAAIA
jgi:AraC-like DNA-binding protein